MFPNFCCCIVLVLSALSYQEGRGRTLGGGVCWMYIYIQQCRLTPRVHGSAWPSRDGAGSLLFGAGLRSFGSGYCAIRGLGSRPPLLAVICDALFTRRGPGQDYVMGGQQTLESSQQYFTNMCCQTLPIRQMAPIVWVSTNTSFSVPPFPTHPWEKNYNLSGELI